MSFQINDRLYWLEGKRKAFTLSYDDGIEQDRRLVRMMNERKVRGCLLYTSDAADEP